MSNATCTDRLTIDFVAEAALADSGVNGHQRNNTAASQKSLASFEGLATDKLGLRTEGDVPRNWSPRNILLSANPRDQPTELDIFINYLKLRIDDGRGETMLHIGLEDSGESMKLTEAEANRAF